MKYRILVIIGVTLIILSILMPGCKRASSSLNGNGNVVDKELKIPEFNSINVSGDYNLVIEKSEEYQVTVSLDSNLFSRLLISVEHRTLKLDIEAPASFFPTVLNITIAMPEIVGLNMSGGAKASIAGFRSPEDFTLFMADKSGLEGYVTAGNLFFNLSGDSKATLEGSALKLELTAVDGSVLDMSEYAVMRAQVKLDKGSEAILNVSGQFDVELKNKSNLYFSGNPVFTNTLVTGGSTMSMIQK